MCVIEAHVGAPIHAIPGLSKITDVMVYKSENYLVLEAITRFEMANQRSK